ncbi:hypothetical protein [Clostridium cochlearium]|uniref:Uncharacterized protein n=1 Tax=Clostridium cochlearium TaxID=1494 RepID=A0A7Y3V6Q8_CLOCO|nr:hypothetical protein [Clostridium cochlearium]NOH14852.1 hypothetical protein [Clostridium cochlearium]
MSEIILILAIISSITIAMLSLRYIVKKVEAIERKSLDRPDLIRIYIEDDC